MCLCVCRPQRKKDIKHLATIEAIYYFFREMSELVEGRPYSGIYDNLLYFYAYQYDIVHQAQVERGDISWIIILSKKIN